MSSIFGYIPYPWLYWSLIISYIITVLSLIGIILSENRNPVKSLAWITVLTLLPALGIVLYIFFGRSVKNRKMISRRKRRRLQRARLQTLKAPLPHDLTPENRQLIRLGRTLQHAPYFPGNELTMYNNGRAKFEALKADLRSATDYINLQYYIFSDDTIGTQLADILIERARAGVKVRVIYDHIGSIKTSNRFIRRIRREGIEIYPFFRVVFPWFGSRINWRNHRKLCVVDGRVGYIGGMNIADRYIDGPGKGRIWRDTHLRIEGPAVMALDYSFAVDWNFMGNGLIPIPSTTPPPPDTPGVGIQMLTSGPNSQWSEIAITFLKAIGSAKRRIFIQTPYFLPTEGLYKALQAAALAKIDVRVMIPRKSDSIILTAASYSYITQSMAAGIKFYLFEPGMIHSKTMLVDDQFASVGSTNFDFRSFEHNYESNLMIFSREFNEQLAEQFRADMQLSARVNPAEWRRRPLLQRSIESIVRLLSPIL